jgi:hypothetical protein
MSFIRFSNHRILSRIPELKYITVVLFDLGYTSPAFLLNLFIPYFNHCPCYGSYKSPLEYLVLRSLSPSHDSQSRTICLCRFLDCIACSPSGYWDRLRARKSQKWHVDLSFVPSTYLGNHPKISGLPKFIKGPPRHKGLVN